MIGAGDRRDRFAFDRREVVADDGYGNTAGGWIEHCTVWTAKIPLRRGESVQASRLAGVQPYVLNVLASSQTRAVTTDFRARDTRTGETFNIRTAEPSSDRAQIEFLVEAGVADG